MRRLFIITIAVILSFVLADQASAEFDPEIDYMSVMIEAALAGDRDIGLAAETSRNEKIDKLLLDYQKVSFEDIYLLSKIIYAEAGSEWLSDEWKMCVGEVVLNRVASSEFPDTIRDVIEQEGQYFGRNNSYFKRLRPDRRCVELAIRLLEGERVIDEPSVVFQANFTQGSGTFLKLFDTRLGYTYLCYSSWPELYRT
ncbi:MAG TPA: cell wall hydrolase [Clostridiales bacterium]|nr:cell wall hydrolase [Clostridiales bacterium]